MQIDSDKLLEWISEYAHEFYCWGHDDADMALCVEVHDLRDAIHSGEFDADRPEVNAPNAIKSLADNIERVAFAIPPPNPHTPVLVMHCNEIRRYVRQEIADRQECSEIHKEDDKPSVK